MGDMAHAWAHGGKRAALGSVIRSVIMCRRTYVRCYLHQPNLYHEATAAVTFVTVTNRSEMRFRALRIGKAAPSAASGDRPRPLYFLSTMVL